MPIVDVTCASTVDEGRLVRLLEMLPHAVSVAVECPEEPYDQVLRPGDVDLRVRRRGVHDAGGLDVVVEVRSKWFVSRSRNRQERCDRLCAAIVDAVGIASVGVYLSLPVAAWSQGD
jgi:hypothetical protein